MTFGDGVPLGEQDFSSLFFEILNAEGAEISPVRLSVVGQRLATKLEKPLREVLGGEKLKRVLERSLKGKAIFEGYGPQLTVRISQPEEEAARKIRFDPRFWAAFSKAILPGKRRYIDLSRPFNFIDTEDLSSDSGKIEIPRVSIPDPAIPKPERDSRIVNNIEVWCEANSLRSSDFVFVPHSPTSAPVEQAIPFFLQRVTPTSSRVDVLLKMIEAIPTEERAKYSLPLNLIYRLIAAT